MSLTEQRIDNAAERYLHRKQIIDTYEQKTRTAVSRLETAHEQNSRVTLEFIRCMGVMACSFSRLVVLVPVARKDMKILDPAYEMYARDGESITDFAMRRTFGIDATAN